MRKSLRGDARGLLRASVSIAAGVCAAIVVAGFLGALHPALDTIGQFRAHAAVLLGALAFVLAAFRRYGAALGSLAASALGIYSVLPFMLAAQNAPGALSGAPRYTLLQMNLQWDARSHDETLGLIARLRPDVVSLQEVAPGWKADFERLRSAYPFQSYCSEPFRHGDTGILSRRPFVEAKNGDGRSVCRDDERLSTRSIDFNGFPVTIGSQHLTWPWPKPQAKMVTALQPVLEQLADPLIIAGDFNAAPWSDSVRRYAEASRTRVVAGIGASWMTQFLPTSLAPYAGLPIDNLLVSDGIEVLGAQTMAPTDSDHLPVLLTFTMRFALPEEPDTQSASRR